ncbi:MAG TPA: phage holin family protein [Bacteroidia bacterium]|jgi:putative membrane protein|nr:phage holin family protein [Bacteroidia bacterium]
MDFIIKLIISSLAVLISTALLPGVRIDDNNFFTALIVAAVLAFLNAVVKPIMIVFTIPITIVTLGFFLLIINACMILLASKLVSGFHVDGFWWALLFSLILSIVTSILESLKQKDRRNDNNQ